MVTATRPPMTSEELEARALTRAYRERVHIFSVPGRPGVYVTRSRSNPEERYNLVARDGVVACSCKGYEYRATCKHAQALLNRRAREEVQARRDGSGPLAA